MMYGVFRMCWVYGFVVVIIVYFIFKGFIGNFLDVYDN